MSKVLILIPSRMSAKRLPNKPLLKINNLSIISHVVKRGKETGLGDVIVVVDDVAGVDIAAHHAVVQGGRRLAVRVGALHD